jgi:hypothetical protein
MKRNGSVRDEGDFALTEKGKLDWRTAQTCCCNPRLVGLLIECPDCGTIYGSLRDSSAFGTSTRMDWKR